MIFIFGDSHALFSTKKLSKEHINLYSIGTTMYRIGRDNSIINFQTYFNNKNNSFIFFNGEIDCRCHIYRQIKLGRKADEIIEELVNNYINTIENNIKLYNKIIINSVIPPVDKEYHANKNGAIEEHLDYAILGSNKERVFYTLVMNYKLKQKCIEKNYIFLDTYEYYSTYDGTFKKEFADDTLVHLNDSTYLCQKLEKILE